MNTRGVTRRQRKPEILKPLPYSRDLAIKQNAEVATENKHPLVDQVTNKLLRNYEEASKARFDQIWSVLLELEDGFGRRDFVNWVNRTLEAKLGFKLSIVTLEQASIGSLNLSALYSECVFQQFLEFSKEFFEKDPLKGQHKTDLQKMFLDMGYHAIGVAPCADGRLAHFVSYVLRLPYSMVRRKSHAGALFDVSESVRNWVFTEHLRFRESKPNSANDDTRYLKIASYHFSKSDPHHQGCAAHGSDDAKAAKAALDKLNEFKQAIENRFDCGATVDVILLGVNTDDDSLRVHVPDEFGRVDLQSYVDTHKLYHHTMNFTAEQARNEILNALTVTRKRSRTDQASRLRKVLAWLIEQNLSQIDYVHQYESGCYSDLGHAERFIGIGSGFEEVQLRNLTYYSFLETLEEGLSDVKVGIKIFKKLNVCKMRPIPIIIGFEYDARVPGSKSRVIKKAKRIEQLVHEKFSELSQSGMLHTMCTLRDYTGFHPAYRLDD